MGRFAPFLAGGLLALVAVEHLGSPADTAARWFNEAIAAPAATAQPQTPNRTTKGDRLTLTRHVAVASDGVVAVEVVGLKNAPAVIYRGRDGRVLFQSDPSGRLTRVSKGVRIPEVTIKQLETPALQPASAPAAKAPTLEPKLQDGCDSAFSPVAAPALANLSGRCVAAIEAPVQVAALAGTVR